jgi:hypothetical protein
MESKTRVVNGRQLARLLGVSQDFYRQALKDFRHPWLNVRVESHPGFLNPKDFFARRNLYEGFPMQVVRHDRKVNGERYLHSLDLWFESLWCQHFVYVGKTPAGEDVSISFAGDGAPKKVVLMNPEKDDYRGVHIVYRAMARSSS